jgi:L-fuculose-phosphate aldolase
MVPVGGWQADVPLTSVVMASDGELQTAREELVSYCQRLVADGLAVVAAGNMSVRVGELVAITPSGVRYSDLIPPDICVVTVSGEEVAAREKPSTELPMHLAVYASTGAAAVVHTHSAEVIALSATHDELPAVHYAITDLGGPVRVAQYARFGSAGLAAAAVGALVDRSAAILQNHGAICYGRTLTQAYDRALLVEWLAKVYRLACSYGQPRILTQSELDEVSAESKRIQYGERRQSARGFESR